MSNYKEGRGHYHTIAAKGNEIFYYGWNIERKSVIVYKLAFDENAQPTQETQGDKKVWVNTPEVKEFTNLTELNPNAQMVYNAFAVNPVTGNLMVYTLKGFGAAYKTRNILSINTTTGELVTDYQNVFGSFASGFWFNK